MNKIKLKSFAKKNSSTILTIMGAAGVVGTVILSIKATPKAVEVLKKAREEKSEDLTRFEVVKTVAPIYIPTVVLGASTIACIFGANVLNKKQQASLASAYALVDNSYKKYQKKLKELYGKEADLKIREEIAKESYDADHMFITPYNGFEDDSHEAEAVTFYDEVSERYFESSILSVQMAEYYLNRNYTLGGAVSINEFYEFLGLPKIDGGDDIGWCAYDGICWLDFSHEKIVLDDGLEIYMLRPIFSPSDLEDF